VHHQSGAFALCVALSASLSYNRKSVLNHRCFHNSLIFFDNNPCSKPRFRLQTFTSFHSWVFIIYPRFFYKIQYKLLNGLFCQFSLLYHKTIATIMAHFNMMPNLHKVLSLQSTICKLTSIFHGCDLDTNGLSNSSGLPALNSTLSLIAEYDVHIHNLGLIYSIP
jgi:hypothetical protein